MSTGRAGGRILVIKLGALGDFIQALGPFAAIRRHHAADHVTLLTTAPYAALAESSRLFNAVRRLERLRWWQLGAWAALRGWLRDAGFRRVYDLQTGDRSSFLFQLMLPGPRPEWSGIAAGCSHPHANRRRDFMHTVDRQREQLRMAGIEDVPPADLSFLDADIARYGLPPRFALLVPGGSAKRPAKRWPEGHYAALARDLAARGIAPVVIGGRDEAELARRLAREAGAIDLAGKTSLADIAALARRAAAALGNDTGPMHVVAAAGAPSLVLFSSDSNPDLCAPRGSVVRVLRRDRLADLPVAEVAACMPMR